MWLMTFKPFWWEIQTMNFFDLDFDGAEFGWGPNVVGHNLHSFVYSSFERVSSRWLLVWLRFHQNKLTEVVGFEHWWTFHLHGEFVMNKDGCKVDTVVEPEIKLKIDNAVLITRKMGRFSCCVTAEVLELPLEELWVNSIQYKNLPFTALLDKNPSTSFQGYKLFLDQTSYYLTLNKLEVNKNAWMHESEYSVCSSISWGQKTFQLWANRANFLCHNGLKFFLKHTIFVGDVYETIWAWHREWMNLDFSQSAKPKHAFSERIFPHDGYSWRKDSIH